MLSKYMLHFNIPLLKTISVTIMIATLATPVFGVSLDQRVTTLEATAYTKADAKIDKTEMMAAMKANKAEMAAA